MKKILVGFFIAFLSTNLCFSAIGDWTTYTNMNSVQKMTVQRNSIWCATTGGAFVFDLEHSSMVKLTNVDGLGGNTLYSIAVDTSESYWFGADNGTLTKYNSLNGNWIVYNDFHDSEKGNLKLNYILPDGDRLWVASNIGVSLFLIYRNGGELKETYRHLGENIESEKEVNCLHIAGNRIWAGTVKGISFADKNDDYLQDYTHWISFTQSPTGLKNDYVYCITSAGDQIYVGTKAGVFHFISLDSSWEEVTGLGNQQIRDLKYINGYLFAATNNGVYKYISGNWEQLSNSGLSSVDLNCITADSSLNLWAATQTKGIAKYIDTSSSWRNHSISGPPGNIFRDVEIGQQGTIWCAQGPYNVSSFDRTNWTAYDSLLSPLIGGNGIERLKEFPDKTLWFESWGGGLARKDSLGNWSKYDSTNSPLKGISNHPNYVVLFGVAVDANGNVWFANRETGDGTLLVVAQKASDFDWAAFKKSSQLPFPGSTINYIIAKDNHIWICFRDYGITDFKFQWTAQGKVCATCASTVRTYNIADWLPTNEVMTCAFDKEGVLWVGTSAGLSYYSDIYGKFIDFALPDSQGPQVRTIVVDGRNRKWIGTSTGFCILENGKFTASYFPSNSKLVGSQVNKIAINNSTGEAWIATESGLSRYQYGLGLAENDLSLVTTHPNPFVIREKGDKVTFDRLPYQTKVKIYTVSGELVKEIDSSDQWDGTNQAGKLVSSGVYLFYLFDQQGRSALGKLALIRE